MKKALIIAVATLFVIALAAGTALAATPSVIGSDGASVWTYKDLQDSTAKTEGAYRAFDDPITQKYSKDTGDGTPGQTDTSGPHGGYDTTTNKCKVCHAVHRAEGSYYLLRADSQDDACDYCHIGGSAHSNNTVYDLNPNGKQTTNGHTIGASSTIPDSSIDQWLVDVTLTASDADGNPVTETVQVRAYDANKNQMYRFARHHGQGIAGTGRSGYMRIGPLALRCMNCHQPHNAINMTWRPTDKNNMTQKVGYKLLRKFPSGSVKPGSAPNTYGMYNAQDIIQVPEETMTADNTGYDAEGGSTNPAVPNTIYTAFVGEPNNTDPHQAPQTVNQFTLSPWCADCHNLNIGYWKHLTNEELGYKSHSDRTHPAPYTGAHNGPSQCYSCHRNDLPTRSTVDSGCSRCHFGTDAYEATNDNVNGLYPIGTSAPDGKSDFPHSGQPNAIKLLGPWLAQYSANKSASAVLNMPISAGGVDATGSAVTVSENTIDGVCLRCHIGIGTNH
ncbi:MAG: hypothetical protein K6T91_07750 [Firmicutes bacterium]|nr:hypothetical protein [Bacillota bacterium]